MREYQEKLLMCIVEKVIGQYFFSFGNSSDRGGRYFMRANRKFSQKNLLLSPLSLAVWYMDDGCWTGKKIVISTESFKGESINTLQDTLLRQFNLDTVVGKNGKLVIRKKSHITFCHIIAKHIIPSMRYKLPNPVTT